MAKPNHPSTLHSITSECDHIRKSTNFLHLGKVRISLKQVLWYAHAFMYVRTYACACHKTCLTTPRDYQLDYQGLTFMEHLSALSTYIMYSTIEKGTHLCIESTAVYCHCAGRPFGEYHSSSAALGQQQV